MDVTITVSRPSTGARADVRLVAVDTEPAGPMLDKLRDVVSGRANDAVHAEGRPLDPQGTVRGCELTDGMVLSVGQPVTCTAPSGCPRAGELMVAVVAGPSAGLQAPLTTPRLLVGRGSDCRLQLDDAAVSRRHLALMVDENGGVSVEDLGSRNGSTLDGQRLDAHRAVRLEPGCRIRIGDSELAVRRRRPDARLVPTTAGRLAVHRSPRPPGGGQPVEIRLPQPPAAPSPARLPVLAAAAPLVVGLLLALVLHQWQFLAFTALSPVMIVGQAVSDRRASRRTHRAAVDDHRRALAAARAAVESARAEERVRRRAAAPDLASLVGAATHRTTELWQRGRDDPDAFAVRLGLGDPPSEVTVVGESAAAASDVPVSVSLRDEEVLGIAGPVHTATALARSLVVQAVTMHGPSHCRLVVVAPGRGEEWSWVRWLPHVLPGAGEGCAALIATDERQGAARLAEIAATEPAPGAPTTLLLVDATAAPGARPLDGALAVVARRCCTIWLAADPHALPAGCRVVVAVRDGPGPGLTMTGPTGRALEVHPDLLARPVAEATARALAPLRDGMGAATAELPATVAWSDVGALDLATPARAVSSLVRRWVAGPCTAVPLGRGTDGDVIVDLAADGPHALVAGTTGSGKSELLQTLVAGLAAANRPEDLALLLVDFKGGAAFGSCDRLPHTVGVVTDLDTATTGRALVSLEAELRRRERVLAAVGATDLDGYAAAAAGRDDAPARPPRLVIVVDEFATLVEELPDFVGGLVGIAQRGRSLGVHLVLATQRPEGMVAADIRANTRLRICLAVTREADSRDVIDGPQAAAIGPGTPGRAFLRAGPGPLTAMQTARVSTATARPPARVTLSPGAHLGRPPAPAVTDPDGASDLDRLVVAAAAAVERLGCVTPDAPWLPPLPECLPLSDLAVAAPGQAGWGLVDLPGQQRQALLTLSLTQGGTLLLAGTAQSGRTTALRSLVTAAAGALAPDRLHLWAVDGGGGLATLDALPHCGGVIPAHDLDRLDRLLDRVEVEVSSRRRDGWDGRPLLLLAVDGWEALLAAAGDGGRPVDRLLRLAGDGPAAGLHLVVTAGRGGLIGRLAAATPDRLVLRLPDRSDVSLLGMPLREVPEHLPPGRAIRAQDLSFVQIAVPDAAAVARAAAWAPPAEAGVRRIDPLPDVIRLDDLGPPADRFGQPILRLGLRADDHAPALHDPRDGGALLVCGPPRSGRSTALVLLAHQLTGPVAAVCPRRSPLTGPAAPPGVVELPAGDQEHAVALLDAMVGPDGTAPAVLVDDADLLADGPLSDRLEALARGARDGRSLLVLAGPTEALVGAFRGPIAQTRRGRAGLLLRPAGPHDGELLGVRLPRRDARNDPPGRGWWVLHGEATSIQVATAGGVSPSPLPGAGSSRHAPAPPSGLCCVPPASTRTAPGRRR